MRSLYQVLLGILLFMVPQYGCAWPASYRYLMANFKRCQQEKPDVVMWVQGRASNPTHRAIIRELLANKRAWPKNIRIAAFFMVGTSKDRQLQIRLQYEFELYGDIVQNDYTEHYKNQTAKMMSAIRFLSDYCGDSKLAIRIDDDVLFHPATMIEKVMNLMTKNTSNSYDEIEDYHSHSRYIRSLDNHNYLSNSSKHSHVKSNSPNIVKKQMTKSYSSRFSNENTILCHILSKREIIRPDMGRSYPVPYSVLPGEKLYPDFCAGFFLAMSTDLLPKFKSMFAIERPFWIDDSYLGVLQRCLKTINVKANEFLLFDVPKGMNLRRLVSAGTTMDAIAVHLMQGSDYYNHIAHSNVFEELGYAYLRQF